MAEAKHGTSTVRMSLREAHALLVGAHGSRPYAELRLREEGQADRLPWGYLRKTGDASDAEFWPSARINFEESSADVGYTMFVVGPGVGDAGVRRTEYYGIWVSRAHVQALLPAEPSTDEEKPSSRLGPQMRRVLQALKKAYPPGGKPPDGVPTKVVWARVCEELKDDSEKKGLAAPSWDTVKRALGLLR
jgi:hypothetical protein